MYNLDKNVIAPVLVVYELGEGIPMYMFEGLDIMQSVIEGYLTIDNQKVYLTTKSINFIKEVLSVKEGMVN